ncbi:GH116 family glycosyl hydrolase [Psychromonas sp. KJ10-10]|uniref:GH116 family glycosyl hydrolase n=1 Tax=Psychromonas sp. KJ10-10 TaxID=3391823 RepID=UPI0039B6C24D
MQSLGLAVTGEAITDIKILNQYLDDASWSQSLQDIGIELPQPCSKQELRHLKKQLLVETAPQAFTAAYQSILSLDSDNSFGDALLADTYQKLNGLGGLFEQHKVTGTLDYIYEHNFKINSPKLGVANMTCADGFPCEEFQAQDVWIGVQFSVASALRLAGKQEQAEQLIDTVYDALYNCAKIPFAAPEGFNCSVVVNESDLSEQFNLTNEESKNCLMALKEVGCLLTDGRVDSFLTESAEQFESLIKASSITDMNSEVIANLHSWLQDTGMKYTAGRYFRPGMIFSYLPEALK